ncbi:hypothetical protein VCHA31O73_360040 [Vibrio chagasii]|nr:hypothetical protein VCHA31O73_360040 [Vibrio chagasii]
MKNVYNVYLLDNKKIAISEKSKMEINEITDKGAQFVDVIYANTTDEANKKLRGESSNACEIVSGLNIIFNIVFLLAALACVFYLVESRHIDQYIIGTAAFFFNGMFWFFKMLLMKIYHNTLKD